MIEMNHITSHSPKVEQLQEDEQSHSTVIADNHGFEGYVPVLPPSFTSLLTNCSEMGQGIYLCGAVMQRSSYLVYIQVFTFLILGDVVAANILSDPSASHEADLRSLIVV